MTYGKSTMQEEFEADLEANLATLRKNIDLLDDPADRGMAAGLCDWYDRYGNLSSKQSYRASQFWATVNSLGATQHSPSSPLVKAASATVSSAPRPTVLSTPNRINGFPLLEKFDKAAKELKYPRIIYTCRDDTLSTYSLKKIHLYRLGEDSKFTGCINITDGRSYPNRIVLGRIQRDGSVILGGYTTDKPPLREFLKQLIENFTTVLAVNGIKTGHCCFCNLALTNKESLKRGYGPICASNFGLPWDDSPARLLQHLT